MNTNVLVDHHHVETVAPERWSEEWWADFLKKSANFKNSLVIKDMISEAEVNDYNAMVMDAVREICVREESNVDFRVYLDGKEQPLPYLVSEVYNNPPIAGDTPVSWTERLFADEKFGIIVNYGEKFSTKLAEDIAKRYRPLLELSGIPLSGINITIFLGNYGFTPLGIHKDYPGENVMHFHLGPGGKTMYNWEVDFYESHAEKGDNNKNVAPFLSSADVYPFETGDLYFMPWDKYHIGYTGDFSVGISVWYNNMPGHKILPTIMKSMAFTHLQPENKSDVNTIVKPVKDPFETESFSAIASVLNMDDESWDLPFSEFLGKQYEDYVLALASNEGWKTRPLSLEEENRVATDYMSLKGKDVALVKPFKMVCQVKDDQELIVYARGTTIEIRYHEKLTEIIEILNEGLPVNTNALLALLANDWPEEAGLYFLGLLLDKRAINII